MADIVYPPGCRPLTEDLGTDELIRRLKVFSQIMSPKYFHFQFSCKIVKQ